MGRGAPAGRRDFGLSSNRFPTLAPVSKRRSSAAAVEGADSVSLLAAPGAAPRTRVPFLVPICGEGLLKNSGGLPPSFDGFCRFHSRLQPAALDSRSTFEGGSMKSVFFVLLLALSGQAQASVYECSGFAHVDEYRSTV